MTHWKLTLAYHGQGFHGWQVQPGLATVQGVLAEALHRLTGESVLPQGAGRTDTGVHALAQVCSFCLDARLPAESLRRALNRILPSAIRVISAEVTDALFHARHSARGKRYEYRIFERRPKAGGADPVEQICSPFLAPFVWDCRWPLALPAMQAGAQAFVGTRNFRAMAASSRPERGATDGRDRTPIPNPVKTVFSAQWTRSSLDHLLVFRIHGTGFLHHMVRNIVGTLVEVGRGSLAPEEIPRILDSRDRTEAGPTAPAHGLYLLEVLYGEQDPSMSSMQPGPEMVALT